MKYPARSMERNKKRLLISIFTLFVACPSLSCSRSQVGVIAPAVPVARQSMTHDFGVVRTGERVTHRFVVRNGGPTPWTFKTFQAECACTVTKASAPLVPAGGETEVEVQYAAALKPADIRKRVVVEFEEDDAPPVTLEFVATVRDLLTAIPDELTLAEIGVGRASEASFELQNYSGRDLVEMTARATAPWLSARVVPVPSGGLGATSPRGRWRVVVGVDARHLGPGRHRDEVLVESAGSGLPSKRVPVTVDVASPVQAVPSRLFFGSVAPSRPTRQVIVVRFAGGTPPGVEATLPRHDLGDRLQIETVRSTGSPYWELAATLTPRAGDNLIEGSLIFEFTNPTLPVVRVPILAKVDEP